MKNVFKDAVEEFGVVPQLVMTMEESAELTQALSKYLRGENNQDNIAEEIADVYIMLGQLKFIFNNEKLVNDYIDRKVQRLFETIQNHKNNSIKKVD